MAIEPYKKLTMTGLTKENEAGQRAISWLPSQIHVVETVRSCGAVALFHRTHLMFQDGSRSSSARARVPL
jgi:hypothetical protein